MTVIGDEEIVVEGEAMQVLPQQQQKHLASSSNAAAVLLRMDPNTEFDVVPSVGGVCGT